MPATIDLNDLTPELRKRLGVKKPRRAPRLSRDKVRTLAFRVLAVVAELTPAERTRVLAFAAKLNAL